MTTGDQSAKEAAGSPEAGKDNRGRAGGFDLAVIVPTLNERANIEPLLGLLDRALEPIRWEAIFVDDDSSDGTAETVWAAALARPNVRCLRRIGRRGLASACIEGMLASGAPFLAVMDGDLQHDETLLPRMLAMLQAGALDIVIASRFAAGSTMAAFSSRRERLSRIGNWMSRQVCRAELSDPLSGFFMLRRTVLNEVAYSLAGLGFKILVDIFASSRRSLRFAEIPCVFRARRHGDSKLDSAVIAEFGLLLCDKALGRYVPARFLAFLMVGVGGMFIHMGALGIASWALRAPFLTSQALATVVAIFWNYYLNNEFTYRDRRRKGSSFWRGLTVFYAACAFGALINYQLAKVLFESGIAWLPAGAAGAFVGGIWNYNMTSFFVWTSRKPKPA
jgi:dolichol-phosphate mannosyltransferase